MRVLMLGWEYPPHISGGLGTACEGLTRALAQQGVDIQFVLPQVLGGEDAGHMALINASGGDSPQLQSAVGTTSSTIVTSLLAKGQSSSVTYIPIPSFLQPYWNPAQYRQSLKEVRKSMVLARRQHKRMLRSQSTGVETAVQSAGHKVVHYGHDIFQEVGRYANNVLAQVGDSSFDIIHAHDWMTFPAAVALSEVSGKPLVVHVHSLEFDRSGAHVNHQISQIERMGVREADMVIAVSYYTASVIQREHGVDPSRIAVVHNGVYPAQVTQRYREEEEDGSAGKVVLFLGRVTFQKGPDYFVEAAAKVIPHVPDAVFVMAGSGDMLQRMIDRVHQLGIQDNFRFPGFLRGEEVERMYSLADLYVMPSVSEPFGISALEALSFDTPVIISRQAGVGEVLSHALKVDFWDIDRMADLIINALLHEELRADLVAMAREEVKRVRWGASAHKAIEIYRRLVQ